MPVVAFNDLVRASGTRQMAPYTYAKFRLDLPKNAIQYLVLASGAGVMNPSGLSLGGAYHDKNGYSTSNPFGIEVENNDSDGNSDVTVTLYNYSDQSCVIGWYVLLLPYEYGTLGEAEAVLLESGSLGKG